MPSTPTFSGQGQNTSPNPRQYLLGLGSSLGDTVGHLAAAAFELSRHPQLTLGEKANIYLTEPEGAAQQTFANSAVTVTTSLEPLKLLAVAKTIEQHLGRKPRGRWQDREIDIDLLMEKDAPAYYNEQPQLWLPHKLFWQRSFALAPAKDIAATWQHPYFLSTVAEAWQALCLADERALALSTAGSSARRTVPWPESGS